MEAFNIEHPVGSPVTVLVDGQGVAHATVERPAKLFGNHMVVWLSGFPGCIELRHVCGYHNPDIRGN